MKKEVLTIFAAHSDFKNYPLVERAYDILTEVVDKYNHTGLHKDKLEIKTREFQRDQNLSNPNAPKIQTASSIMKEAEKSATVFTLVEGSMSERIREWYLDALNLVKKEKADNQTPLPVFWNIASAESEAKYNSFIQNLPDSNFIHTYKDDKELSEIFSNMISELATSWVRSIERGKAIPTLSSIRKRNKIRILFKWAILGVVIAFVFFVLCWCSARNKRSATVKPIVDVHKEQFQRRITNAEDLIHQEQYAPARDSLNVLKGACKPEWSEEKAKVDSLLDTIPATPFVGTPSSRSGSSAYSDKAHSGKVDGNNPQMTLSYNSNAYEIQYIGAGSDFKTLIQQSIESVSSLRRIEGKNALWHIMITELRSERGIDDGDFFVNVTVNVDIVNNQTGVHLPQLEPFKVLPPAYSPISYEDAYNQAENKDLANKIALGIKNRLSNE